MTFEAYMQFFESIVQNESTAPEPYNDPEYFQYTKLNWSRMNRWMKVGVINDELKDLVLKIDVPQHWIVITEPWCGDAAHNVPFIELLGRLNSNITVSYELRDSEPFRIESYLSNGAKSIPIVVFKDANENDIAVWGPRPADCQAYFLKAKSEGADMDAIKTAIQHWYNEDKGASLQKELLQILSSK